MLKTIELDKIFSSSNVRNEIDDTLMDLKASIMKNGLLLPICVRKSGDRYEVIDGHRRFAALRLIGEPFVECNILDDVTDKDRLFMQVEANIQRKQMSAYELVTFADEIHDKYGLNDKQISKFLHKSENYMSDQRYAVRLLEAQYGKDIPEDKKTMSSGMIKATAKKKSQGNEVRTIGNGYQCIARGHHYLITTNSFEFESELNNLLNKYK